MLLTSWLVGVLPFTVCDVMGWCQQYKVQPQMHWKAVPAKLKMACVRMVATNWAWLLPTVIAASPVLQHLLQPPQAPLPSLPQAMLYIAAWFVLDDLSFYAYHRLLHS